MAKKKGEKISKHLEKIETLLKELEVEEPLKNKKKAKKKSSKSRKTPKKKKTRTPKKKKTNSPKKTSKKKKKKEKKKTTKKKTASSKKTKAHKKRISILSKIFKKPKHKKKKEAKKEIIVRTVGRAKKIPTILIKDIMLSNPKKIKESSRVEEAIDLLSEKGVTCLPVVSKNKLTGMISEENVLNFLSEFMKLEKGDLSKNRKLMDKLSQTKVKSVMSKKAPTVTKRDSIEEAIKKMNKEDVDQLGVLEKNKFVGLLTREEIVAALKKDNAGKKIIKNKIIVTDIDKFLDLIKGTKAITSEEAAKKLELSIKTIEEWGKILEKKGLIDIEYPPTGGLKFIGA